MPHGWWDGWGPSWGAMAMMIVFWLLVIAVVVILARWLMDRSGSTREKVERKEESAIDILNRRYARGEIDRQEYEEKRRDLQP